MLSFSRLTSAIMAAALIVSLSGCANVPVARVNVNYWPTSGKSSEFIYPERRNPEVWSDLVKKDDLGICFSGGGTRASTAAAGQLRGLEKLGILKRVRYISGVSGGAWAATPYTFIADEKLAGFLEEYVAPEAFEDGKHLRPGKGSLAGAATKAHIVWPGVGRTAALRGAEAYSRTLHDHFLKPFGLGGYEGWFTWNERTMQDIRSRNPGVKALTGIMPHMVPEGRPFLIAGGTVRNYELFNWKSAEEKRIPFEMTPLYAGTPRWYAEPTKHFRQPIGGGYIETFAFDSIRPSKQASGHASAELYRRLPFRNHATPGLGDVVGISGAALGEIQAPVLFLGHPRYNSWSPQTLENNGSVTDQRENYQDGGHSDNLGIMPLLARRVPTIVAFVNSETPLKGEVLPDYVAALFREDKKVPEKTMYHNMQVFSSDRAAEIGAQVHRSVAAGGPAIAHTRLTTLACPRFGVPVYNVEVFWVFLEATTSGEHCGRASQNWIEELPRHSVTKQRLRDGRINDFPTYKTFFHNRNKLLWDVIDLSEEQAALLAHYAAWTVAGPKSPIQKLRRR